VSGGTEHTPAVRHPLLSTQRGARVQLWDKRGGRKGSPTGNWLARQPPPRLAAAAGSLTRSRWPSLTATGPGALSHSTRTSMFWKQTAPEHVRRIPECGQRSPRLHAWASPEVVPTKKEGRQKVTRRPGRPRGR
jgi:hypothetical protein